MTEPNMVQDVEVAKPAVDEKQYRYVVLKNSIKALLISDPRIDTTPGVCPQVDAFWVLAAHLQWICRNETKKNDRR